MRSSLSYEKFDNQLLRTGKNCISKYLILSSVLCIAIALITSLEGCIIYFCAALKLLITLVLTIMKLIAIRAYQNVNYQIFMFL